MKRYVLAILKVSALVVFSLPRAQAAEAQITSFSASALQIEVGGTVDFELSYGLLTSAVRDGGNEPNEPAPMEGYQEWFRNWYTFDLETPVSVTVHADGQGFTDLAMSPAEGGSLTGTWRFSKLFPQVGQFDMTAGGDWSVQRVTGYSHEISSRYCQTSGDLDYVTTINCDSWSSVYPHEENFSSYGGQLNTITLKIDVLPAVPEPGALALTLTGAGVMAWRLRRRPNRYA